MQINSSKLCLALLIIILLSSGVQANIVEQSDLRIGISDDRVIELLGQPSRVDPTPFEYEWWIYNQDYENYFQIAVKGEEVVRIYSNSKNWGYKEAQIGKRVSEVKNFLPLSLSTEVEYNGFEFTLVSSGRTEWSYIFVDNENGVDTVVEVIYDNHNQNRVTSILLSDIESKLAFGNHALSYKILAGYMPEFAIRELSTKEQRKVDQGMEAQLLDLVNSIRVRKGIHPLYWHQPIAEVALEHSKDMYYNNFFAHESPSTGWPRERVENANIDYINLSENISTGRKNAIFTHEGLMNSLGHRKTILNENFVELGTGVYKSYNTTLRNMYTQKFRRRSGEQLKRLSNNEPVNGKQAVNVKKALFSLGLRYVTEDSMLCTIDANLMERLDLEVGQKIKLKNSTKSQTKYYTIAEAIDEGSDIIRMGVEGRRRIGEEGIFRGYIVLPD